MDSGGSFEARVKAASRRDWMIMGGGTAALVLSFFPFVGVSYFSVDAWTGYATLGMLLLLAAATAWALTVLRVATVPTLPVPLVRAVAIAAGVGTGLIALRGLTYSSLGFRFGGVLLIAAGVVVTVGAILTERAAGPTPPDQPGS